MKRIVIFCTCILFALSSLSISAETPEKINDIKKLLELTGGFTVGDQLQDALTPQIIELLKKSNKKPTEKTIATVKAELKKVIDNSIYAKGGLVEKLCKIYSKYYTHDEIKKLIAFYESDIGKKTTEVMPLLLKESIAFSQEWGNTIAPTVVSQLRSGLKKKGIILPEI